MQDTASMTPTSVVESYVIFPHHDSSIRFVHNKGNRGLLRCSGSSRCFGSSRKQYASVGTITYPSLNDFMHKYFKNYLRNVKTYPIEVRSTLWEAAPRPSWWPEVQIQRLSWQSAEIELDNREICIRYWNIRWYGTCRQTRREGRARLTWYLRGDSWPCYILGCSTAEIWRELEHALWWGIIMSSKTMLTGADN